MNVVTLKQDIHLLIDSITDSEILHAVKTLLEKNAKVQTDWWETISEEERAEILQGLSEADNNDLMAHDEVMEKYKKWLH
jgi:predicted transcriptional regulator